MKLYATVTSERDSRPAKKGGDEKILIEIGYKNDRKFFVNFDIQHDILHINVGEHRAPQCPWPAGRNYLCESIELKATT